MHSTMEITGGFYSNRNEGEAQDGINGVNNQGQPLEDNELELFREFLTVKRNWALHIKSCELYSWGV